MCRSGVAECTNAAVRGSHRRPALRGVEKLRRVPGGFQPVLPTDVAGQMHVDDNQAYRFVLEPGRYVLVGTYDDSGGMQTSLSVNIRPGITLQHNLPDICK